MGIDSPVATHMAPVQAVLLLGLALSPTAEGVVVLIVLVWAALPFVLAPLLLVRAVIRCRRFFCVPQVAASLSFVALFGLYNLPLPFAGDAGTVTLLWLGLILATLGNLTGAWAVFRPLERRRPGPKPVR